MKLAILMIYADKHALLGSRGKTFTWIYGHLVLGDDTEAVPRVTAAFTPKMITRIFAQQRNAGE